ncbi:MAG TPA: hypothetical protein VFE82_10370 [Ramlibacter sp.]|uniref:hypothetical protein n=1 Tax=Ramlibacter sp. TaxID=1917967 RepID=UPI002D6C58BB|nr:hypothetical protein [Ramlibacter sp.]HZY18877.1 hypothetical protein [Ramlibacter sp.]
MQPRRGYDTDISGGVGEVYDIDRTPFNKELVCRWTVEGRTINVGKATAMVVFDRESKKAIGWKVYVGEESWKEGYRLALFCAMTSKKRHLERLGINDPTTFPEDENSVSAFVYVDGGPGASKSGPGALQRCRIDIKKAPPNRPYWKPTVEGSLGHAQADQATDAGAYDRRNRSRSKAKKRTAKLFAAETVFELEKKLVEHLIAYNRALDKRHLLYWETPDGVLDELERDRRGNSNNAAASAYDIKAWTLHLTALSIVNNSKKPKRPGRLSRRQWDRIRDVAGAAPKQQRKRPSKEESLVLTFTFGSAQK